MDALGEASENPRVFSFSCDSTGMTHLHVYATRRASSFAVGPTTL
jgi:hypothetical protein